MNNLFLINEIFTNGYISNILDVISLLAILCGILVIVNKNPIISVLFLIGLFASISSYLILIGLSFIGLSYLIVYIGAVSILFLFILMLINIRISELQSNTSNSIILSFIIIVSLNYLLFQLLPYNLANLNNGYSTDSNDNDINFVTSKIWDGNLAEHSHMTSIGNIMYTNYNLWLIIGSLILLLAMVGAIIITIKQQKN
jgi:NADH-ubiquinone oxidoreductase chain 6